MEGADRRSTVARGDARPIEDREMSEPCRISCSNIIESLGFSGVQDQHTFYILLNLGAGALLTFLIFRKRFTFIVHYKHHTHSVHLRIVMI